MGDEPREPLITMVKGTLEIQHTRGVIYFHLDEAEIRKLGVVGVTMLRVQGMPGPIPLLKTGGGTMLDINVENGWCDWTHEVCKHCGQGKVWKGECDTPYCVNGVCIGSGTSCCRCVSVRIKEE